MRGYKAVTRRHNSGRQSNTEEIQLISKWLDDETWLIILEPALKDRPGSAETAAHIWNRLIEMIMAGSVGKKAAISALEDAIRLSYRFTRASSLAFEHYRLHVGSGDFPPADEPESLLANAIRRFNAAARSTKRRDPPAK